MRKIFFLKFETDWWNSKNRHDQKSKRNVCHVK